MKVTSGAPEAVPAKSTPELNPGLEQQAFKDQLQRMLGGGSGPDLTDKLQAAFAGATQQGVGLSELSSHDAARLLGARQAALEESAQDASAAGEALAPEVEALLETLRGVSGTGAETGTKGPSDDYQAGATPEELQEMKDLMAGHEE